MVTALAFFTASISMATVRFSRYGIHSPGAVRIPMMQPLQPRQRGQQASWSPPRAAHSSSSITQRVTPRSSSDCREQRHHFTRRRTAACFAASPCAAARPSAVTNTTSIGRHCRRARPLASSTGRPAIIASTPVVQRGPGRTVGLFSTSSSRQDIPSMTSTGDYGEKRKQASAIPPRSVPRYTRPSSISSSTRHVIKEEEFRQHQSEKPPLTVAVLVPAPAAAASTDSPIFGAERAANISSRETARSDDQLSLERCRHLAHRLGVPLIFQDEDEGAGGLDGASTGRRHRGKQKVGSLPSRAGGTESDGIRYTMLFDEAGRLALAQPGSGFKPLVVDFAGGRSGHRAKQQQGTEQIAKAAALPKRRRAINIEDKLGTDTSVASVSRSPPASLPERGQKAEKERIGAGEEAGIFAQPGDREEPPLLWDLTAGLGTDAFVLALAGWRVKMFERSPVVAALVQDALDRARECDDEVISAAAHRMTLTIADSVTAVNTSGLPKGMETGDSGADASAAAFADGRPAVVYLDPMFPSQRKKSALVKKGMQMLQGLLEGDEVEEECEGRNRVDEGRKTDGSEDVAGRGTAKEEEEKRLFDVAMSLATRKVVVKRPVHGKSIVGHVAPSHAVVSKNGRFDVYVVE